MDKNKIFSELENIHYKYECLRSIIDILQRFAAEAMVNTGIPSDSLANALFEIEIGMGEANNRLKSLFIEKGGAI